MSIIVLVEAEDLRVAFTYLHATLLKSVFPQASDFEGTHRGENFRGLALLTSRKSLISGIRTIPGFASKIPGFTPKIPGFPVFFPT
jgi:hypothetical protein